ncbi:MAG: hypothetical protein IJ252_11830 [Solobacterium sp.]|nr:hypothetical protein [Solobacterium sp.]
MARRTLNKGFLLAESLAVIVCISLFALLLGSMPVYETDAYHVFPADYCLAQSAAMAKAESCSVDHRSNEFISDIRFSDAGNVNMARTLLLGKGNRTVVIELGFGRLVFR